MPTLSNDDVLLLRSYPHTVKRYLSYVPRDVVFAARVNGNPSIDTKTGGVYAFAYDTVVTGVYGVVKVGQTVDIGSTPLANDVGSTRIRKLPTSNTMYIAETALASLNINDNDYITVRDEYRPWLKLPRLTAVKNKASYTNGFTEYHDYDNAYSDENTDIRPKAIITESATSRNSVKPADFVDEGEIYRTVDLSSFFSYAVAFGATLSSRLWDMVDGTYTVGANTDVNVTVRFPVGFRYISLTVTDSNGTTDTMRWPLWVHDDAYVPVTNFKVTNDTRDSGREMGFEFFGQDGDLTLPEGAVLCYWEAAEFDDQAPPEQYIDSFIGWTLTEGETLKINDSSQYRISVGGIAAWLSKFTGFATTIKSPPSGKPVNKWFKMRHITVDRIAHYVLREYTTALSLCNLFMTDITTESQAEDIKKSDVWSQIVDLEKGNQFSSVIADSLNGIWFRPHYSYMETTDRPAIDIVINLSKQDWIGGGGLVIDRDITDKVSIVDGAGSFVNANHKNKAVYSKAPGLVPAATGGNEEAPFQRLDHSNTLTGQQRLNRFNGHHYARVNNKRNEINIAMIGNFDIIEQAWGEPITLTWLDSSLSDDGSTLNTAEFLITRISVTHSNTVGTASKRISWTLEEATVGEPGLSYYPPESVAPNAIPSFQFPKISLPTIQPFEWVNIPPSVPTLMAIQIGVDQGGGTYRNPTFVADFADIVAPEYTERSFSMSGEKLDDFAVDGFSPYYVGTGSTVNGWGLTNEGIWRVSDCFASVPSTVNQLGFPYIYDGLNAAKIVFSRTRQVWGIATHGATALSSGAPPTGILNVWYTLDGINWTPSLTLNYNGTSNPGVDFIHMSERIPGLVYVGIAEDLYISTDYGANFNLFVPIASPTQLSQGHWIHVPKHDNPSERIVWFAADAMVITMSDPPNVNQLYRVDLDNASFAAIRTLPWPGTEDGTLWRIRGVVQSSKNPGRIVIMVQDYEEEVDLSIFSWRIWTSRDAGATWKDTNAGVFLGKVKFSDLNPDYFLVCGMGAAQPPFNVGYPHALKATIYSTRDFGENYDIRSGNLITLDPVGVATQTTRIVEVIGS